MSRSTSSTRTRSRFLGVLFVLALAAIGVLAVGSAGVAEATAYYWDVNGTTAGFSTVVGTWDGVNNYYWNSDSTGGGGGALIVAPTSDDDLIIPQATTNTGSLTVSGTQNASSITFAANVGPTTTITGGTILIGGTGTNSGIFEASTGANTVSSALTLNSAVSSLAISDTSTGLLTVGAITGSATAGNTQTLNIGSTNTGGITLNGVIGDGTGGGNVALTINNTSTGVTSLTGTASTYTGATTVNSGTLQVNSAGAFNNIARTVAVNSGGTINFSAADAAKAAAVTVNAGGIANFTAASAANGGTFAVSGTASVTLANAANGGTFTINSGGLLTAYNVTNAYSGSTINLNGGTLAFNANTTTPNPRVAGGNIAVSANSMIESQYNTNGRPAMTWQYGTLDFNQDGYQLEVTNLGSSTYQPASMRSKFVGSTISHSGTIYVHRYYEDAGSATSVEMNNTAIRAGKTLTITRAGTTAAYVTGSLGVAMLGGAELLGSNSFNMINASAFTTTFTDTSTFDTTAGLWAKSGTTTIAATLANNAGSIGGSSGVSFASEDAAYVSLTGLTVSTTYDLFLKLADPAKQGIVMTQLGKNPAFSSLASLGADQVQFKFAAPATTSYFAWDNFHTTGDWYLGGDLTYVGFSAWAPPSAKDCLWNGGGGMDVKWSTAANWALTPVTGDTLAFGTPGTGGAVLDNDLDNGRSFASLQFQSGATAFTLDGNSVTLTGKGDDKVIILNNSTNNQIVNLPIVLGANGKIDAAAGNIVVGGDISGDFSLTKIGAGTLTLSGANNTYGGGTVINAGAVVINNTSGTAKLGAAGKNLTLGGGSLDLGGISQTVGALSVTAAAASGDTISNGSLTANSYAVSATGDVAISANLGGGSAGLAKSGAGILTLSGSSNTYAGATTISEGTLKLGVANAIPHGLGKGDVAVGGTLDLNGLNQTVNGLTGAGAVTNSNLAAATLTVGDNNISSIFPGAINDGTGAVALEKIGTGTVILSGTNGYTAGTLVSAGALQFNSAAAIGGTTRNVTVAAVGTVAFGPAFGAIQPTLTGRIVNTSPGTVALMAATSSEALDFSSAGADLTAASLGAVGAVNYSGTLTPNGTTYRLGGGGGTLTVSSSTLIGNNTLVVTGPGTVVLSGSGNTFTGDVTVSSGTLQIATVGAFNNIARAVTVNAGGTATVTASNAANGATFTINPGGWLTAYNATNAYSGSTINLNGGTLVYNASTTTPNPRAVGGNIAVSANSMIQSQYGTNERPAVTWQYGTLDFTQDGYQLEVTELGGSSYQPATMRSKFVGSTISHSGTIYVHRAYEDAGSVTSVEMNNTAIRAGKTLTITRAGTTAAYVTGSLGVAMLGGAEVLGSDSFTMLSAPTTSFTDTSAFDTTAGLWSRSGPSTTTIAATLDNFKGSSALVGSGVSFTAEDAGYVSLTGLTEGSKYDLFLELAVPANLATVMDQLGKNPDFSSVTSTEAGKVQFKFTAPAETSYFAWDNVHITAADWYLGGDLTYVGLSVSTIPGDTNGDKVVDAADYIAIKTNFGLTGTGITRLQGDLVDNDVVDWDDLQELMANFATRSVGDAPAAPEPATLGLLAIGALAVIRRRRRS